MDFGNWIKNICNKLKKGNNSTNSSSSKTAGDANRPING